MSNLKKIYSEYQKNSGQLSFVSCKKGTDHCSLTTDHSCSLTTDHCSLTTDHCSLTTGIYIHIPFCIRKCPYCNFYSITDISLIEDFVKCLLAEINLPLNFTEKRCADTLYIGGGTPSVLPAEYINQIIESASRSFSLVSSSEITIEVNPGTIDDEKLRQYRNAGINRINIGVQSFQDANLKFLGRIHSADHAKSAIQKARKAGFDNVGIDMIFGIPSQSEKAWRYDLEQALKFDPEHISCYMLTIEPSTPLDLDRQKGQFQVLSDTRICRMFRIMQDVLCDHGYVHYEISNFAKDNKMSRHNLKYWSSASYIGLGPAAHSFNEPVRSWNCRSVKDYINRISNSLNPLEGKEILTDEQRMTEVTYTRLRTSDGILIEDFYKRFGQRFEDMFRETITYLKSEGMINITKTRCSLTRKGMLFCDSIAAMFISQG